MSIQDELLKSMQIMIEEAAKKIQSAEYASVVESVRNGKYTVSIDGYKYEVKDGINLQPTVGTPVWVKCPYGKGNMTGAYIMARR